MNTKNIDQIVYAYLTLPHHVPQILSVVQSRNLMMLVKRTLLWCYRGKILLLAVISSGQKDFFTIVPRICR